MRTVEVGAEYAKGVAVKTDFGYRGEMRREGTCLGALALPREHRTVDQRLVFVPENGGTHRLLYRQDCANRRTAIEKCEISAFNKETLQQDDANKSTLSKRTNIKENTVIIYKYRQTLMFPGTRIDTELRGGLYCIIP